jgi:hypothetical protein
MPFWGVRRAIAAAIGVVASTAGRTRRPAPRGTGLAGQLADREARGQRRIGPRIPGGVVDAVDDADHALDVVGQEPVEALAALGGEDLAGVGRTDGGRDVGVGQAALSSESWPQNSACR